MKAAGNSVAMLTGRSTVIVSDLFIHANKPNEQPQELSIQVELIPFGNDQFTVM